MVSQSVIFVDAGFLLAVGGTQVAGTSLRTAFQVDYVRLVQGLLARTFEHSGLGLLRVYWYDASKDALFTDQHKRIGLLPDVKVRLGRISFNGDQKGVDLKLGLDLVGIARNRSASVAYLVSGDDDLAEAVEAAQDLGMKVVLVGVDNPDHRLGVRSVAEHLALRVDSIITLPAELIVECFTNAVGDEPRPTPVPFPVRLGAQHRPVPKPPAS
ncbi:NYN domain-containing protein, partial [Arthrobacter sp. H41]|uniref:NYN domain-containing protein n=1 Tax=Arthrobacter sp. H41 TaxID=1312978 RepID=UPI0020A65435